MPDDHQTQLSQRVEREVRQLLGELQMQTIVLRQLLDMAQQPGQPQPGQPQPQPDQRPVPPGQPTPPPKPDVPQHPTTSMRSNGDGRLPREV